MESIEPKRFIVPFKAYNILLMDGPKFYYVRRYCETPYETMYDWVEKEMSPVPIHVDAEALFSYQEAIRILKHLGEPANVSLIPVPDRP